MIAFCVLLNLNLPPVVLICLSHNPRCLFNLRGVAQGSEPEHAVTPTGKHNRKDGAGHADSNPDDAENQTEFHVTEDEKRV